MSFSAPIMLWGLAALPALAAIYWLRSRSKKKVVSSLIFWLEERAPRQGGRLLRRMQAPLTFFLEAAAITLLVLAAAGPRWTTRAVTRPLVVVLDDSFSMSARLGDGEGDTPRARAASALAEELGSGGYAVRLVLAGPVPRVLAGPLGETGQVREALSAWNCRGGPADLPRAVALAAELGGPDARILVLSDAPPKIKLEGGLVQWRAFGRALPNVAITAAVRARGDVGQRALVEVSNLSDAAAETTLSLQGVGPGRQDAALRLAPGEVRRVTRDLPSWDGFPNPSKAAGRVGKPVLQAPAGAGPLRAALSDDALAADNAALLLPEPLRPLRVRLRLADASLRAAVERAMAAAGDVLWDDARGSDLVVADQSGEMEGAAWRWEILGGKQAVAYAGPFVVDRAHPLARGLSLQNAIWSAAAESAPRGRAVVTTGPATLLGDEEDARGRHRLQMAFLPGSSDLQDLPDWPILVANILQWRREALPGVAAANVRLGQSVAAALPEGTNRVEIRRPDQPPARAEVHGRRVEVVADRAGLYSIAAATLDAPCTFSCNAVCREESDLRGCTSGRWGDWSLSPVYEDRYRPIGWVLLLVALAILAGHLLLVVRSGEGRSP